MNERDDDAALITADYIAQHLVQGRRDALHEHSARLMDAVRAKVTRDTVRTALYGAHGTEGQLKLDYSVPSDYTVPELLTVAKPALVAYIRTIVSLDDYVWALYTYNDDSADTVYFEVKRELPYVRGPITSFLCFVPSLLCGGGGGGSGA